MSCTDKEHKAKVLSQDLQHQTAIRLSQLRFHFLATDISDGNQFGVGGGVLNVNKKANKQQEIEVV